MKQKRQPENDLKKAALEYLRLRGCVVTRHQCGTIHARNGGRDSWLFLGERGWPDVIGFTPTGRFIGIELKSATGRVTQEQQQMIDAMRRAGCAAGIARTLDDVQAILDFR